MRRLFLTALLCLVPVVAGARASVLLKGRAGLQTENSGGAFKCDYLRLTVSGSINDRLSYVVRQRLNKPIPSDNPLAATDYLNLTWRKGDWELSGGKNYITCGDFDYLSSSCDIYMRPVFFNGCGGMYNYVVHGARYFGTEKLVLQFGNSFFSLKPSNLLGGSVFLRGRQGNWEHAYSLNLFERGKGLCNCFVGFGNRFHLGEAVLDLGFMPRFDMSALRLFRDLSTVVKLRFPLSQRVNLLAKATWDYKEAGVQDPILPDGTDIWQAGGGFECYPLKNSRILRLHCVYFNRNGSINCFLAGLLLSLNI